MTETTELMTRLRGRVRESDTAAIDSAVATALRGVAPVMLAQETPRGPAVIRTHLGRTLRGVVAVWLCRADAVDDGPRLATETGLEAACDAVMGECLLHLEDVGLIGAPDADVIRVPWGHPWLALGVDDLDDALQDALPSDALAEVAVDAAEAAVGGEPR